MARPYKQGMDFFPHDTDASNDEKIERMTSLYGNDGYAFCFVLLERIYRAPDARLDVSDAETRIVLADKCRVPLDRWEIMLASALKVLFFSPDEYAAGFLTSEGIRKRAGYVADRRESWRNRKDTQALSAPLSSEKTITIIDKQHYTKQHYTKQQETKEEKPSMSTPENRVDAPTIPYGEILELYHAICVSYPKLRLPISENRKKSIAARWKQRPSLDTFREVFEKAEVSKFMKGANKDGWRATFDWLMNDANMAKILEGNYNIEPKARESEYLQVGEKPREARPYVPEESEYPLVSDWRQGRQP